MLVTLGIDQPRNGGTGLREEPRLGGFDENVRALAVSEREVRELAHEEARSKVSGHSARFRTHAAGELHQSADSLSPPAVVALRAGANKQPPGGRNDEEHPMPDSSGDYTRRGQSRVDAPRPAREEAGVELRGHVGRSTSVSR